MKIQKKAKLQFIEKYNISIANYNEYQIEVIVKKVKVRQSPKREQIPSGDSW